MSAGTPPKGIGGLREEAEATVQAMRQKYAPKTRDDGFTDEDTGEWVSLPSTVRVAGFTDVLALCDLIETLARRIPTGDVGASGGEA